mmetsp:Transcript_21556/g.42338  ORF Transcript_21556/g.42338 Transcript_21556/m.42338 type:complete len:120 (+) Transcript_21556:114-473(+)|eukprot:CAMPEP_0171500244 /NCGR_PEP_ID=MMETSP0958-20121227/8879_1 /TAXON_ID=87120 /ORGANISM="Aurantiochytrium limacinum, Strain ATCCMYA-1381" /LENGTH=119 /DNA_ID=CAMNT_0012034895 /DNA_START=115 /DNA_END=474 /DNA_ORIENTATION=-
MQAARFSISKVARATVANSQRVAVSRAVGFQAQNLVQLRTYKVDPKSAEITGVMNNPQRSDSEFLINKVPPTETDKDTVACDGGGGSLGHPIEYIKIDRINNKPSTCKYCGLRWIAKKH